MRDLGWREVYHSVKGTPRAVPAKGISSKSRLFNQLPWEKDLDPVCYCRD